jgi:hypothetical protein
LEFFEGTRIPHLKVYNHICSHDLSPFLFDDPNKLHVRIQPLPKAGDWNDSLEPSYYGEAKSQKIHVKEKPRRE